MRYMILLSGVQIKYNFLADKFKAPKQSTNNPDISSENPTEPETKTFTAAQTFAPSQLPNQKIESRDLAPTFAWHTQKQQQNDVQQIVTAPTISENVAANIKNPQSAITEQKVLPAMMENLLIAQPAAYASQQLPMPPMQHEQFRKINVEDMFKVDTNNLPQPPPNWRNKMAPSSGALFEWTASVPPPVPSVNSIPTGQARPIKGAGKSKGNDNPFYSSGSGVAATPKSNDGIYHPQPMNMYPQMNSRQPQGPPPPQQTKTFYQVSLTQIIQLIMF